MVGVDVLISVGATHALMVPIALVVGRFRPSVRDDWNLAAGISAAIVGGCVVTWAIAVALNHFFVISVLLR